MYMIQTSMFHCQPRHDCRNYKNRRKSMMALWISSIMLHAVPFTSKVSISLSHICNSRKPCKIFSLLLNSARCFFNNTGINLQKVSQRHHLPWKLTSTLCKGDPCGAGSPMTRARVFMPWKHPLISFNNTWIVVWLFKQLL